MDRLAEDLVQPDKLLERKKNKGKIARKGNKVKLSATGDLENVSRRRNRKEEGKAAIKPSKNANTNNATDSSEEESEEEEENESESEEITETGVNSTHQTDATSADPISTVASNTPTRSSVTTKHNDPKANDYGDLTELITDTISLNAKDYDYHKVLEKDYGLDLASELQAKLNEMRVQYDGQKYQLVKSKAKCNDLESENRRLRKELEQHNRYEMKNSEALLKLTSDLENTRAQHRAIKSKLEAAMLGRPSSHRSSFDLPMPSIDDYNNKSKSKHKKNSRPKASRSPRANQRRRGSPRASQGRRGSPRASQGRRGKPMRRGTGYPRNNSSSKSPSAFRKSMVSALPHVESKAKSYTDTKPLQFSPSMTKKIKSVDSISKAVDDKYEGRLNQINNNRKRYPLINRHQRKPKDGIRDLPERSASSPRQPNTSSYLNSNRHTQVNEPTVILSAPIIGRAARARALSTPAVRTPFSYKPKLNIYKTSNFPSPLNSYKPRKSVKANTKAEPSRKPTGTRRMTKPRPTLSTRKHGVVRKKSIHFSPTSKGLNNVDHHMSAHQRLKALNGQKFKKQSAKRTSQTSRQARMLKSVKSHTRNRSKSANFAKGQSKLRYSRGRSLGRPTRHHRTLLKNPLSASRIRESNSNNNSNFNSEYDMLVQFLNHCLQGTHYDPVTKLFYVGKLSPNLPSHNIHVDQHIDLICSKASNLDLSQRSDSPSLTYNEMQWQLSMSQPNSTRNSSQSSLRDTQDLQFVEEFDMSWSSSHGRYEMYLAEQSHASSMLNIPTERAKKLKKMPRQFSRKASLLAKLLTSQRKATVPMKSSNNASCSFNPKSVASRQTIKQCKPKKATMYRRPPSKKRSMGPYTQAVDCHLKAVVNNHRLNENEKYLKNQYRNLLLTQRKRVLHPGRRAIKSWNTNNNANDSDDEYVDSTEPTNLTAGELQPINEKLNPPHSKSTESLTVNVLKTSFEPETYSFDRGSYFDGDPSGDLFVAEKSKVAFANDNNNAASSQIPHHELNASSNAANYEDGSYYSYASVHPEVTRLQHLLRQREIQREDFLEAFTDALMAKEAAVGLAEERLETVDMLSEEMSKMREEYEDIIRFKDNELKIKEDVLSSYKKERYSLTQAFEKATKCMLAKLSAKNSAIRKMNMAHHDEISQLRRLAMQQESDLNCTSETLQRLKVFHERETAMFNQKIRELNDLIKLKEAEVHNYQQISADVVYMAEKLNLDLRVKDDTIKQLREDLSCFQVGLNEVEGERVLVKQCKTDKRVVSLGFPRIVDGNIIIWYKSRTFGDNFLILRIFGGKLFVVEKRDIIPELNRILPNLMSSPTYTHAALRLDKGTQHPLDPKTCKLPSAMQMQVHLVGDRAHLAVEGRHLCSQKPILFMDDETEHSLNKEITPRPYQRANQGEERAILVTEVDKPNDQSGTDNSNSSQPAARSDSQSEEDSSDDSEGSGEGESSEEESEANDSSDDEDDDSNGDSDDESEGNKSGNARTNYSQNALSTSGKASSAKLDDDWLLEDAAVDLDKYTESLLKEMRESRERVMSRSSNITTESSGEGDQLREVKPSKVKESSLAYTLSWIEEGNGQKDLKSLCGSPRRRLKKVEADVDRLCRRSVHPKPHSPRKTTECVSNERMSELDNDYDWSLPDLEIPIISSGRERRTARPKASSHETTDKEVAISGTGKTTEQSNPVVLTDEVELMGWKAHQLSDDYKFSRLTSEAELERFIEEHTLPEYRHQREELEIKYNENALRFEMHPKKNEEELNQSTNARKERIKPVKEEKTSLLKQTEDPKEK